MVNAVIFDLDGTIVGFYELCKRYLEQSVFKA